MKPIRDYDWKFLGCGALICLPVVAFVAVSVCFFLVKVPQLQSRERGAATRAYREVAEELLRNPETAEGRMAWTNEVRGGRAFVGRLRRLAGNRRWGVRPYGTGQLVWVDERSVKARGKSAVRSVICRRAATEPMTNYAMLFGSAIAVVTLFMVATTWTSLWFFVRRRRERDDFLAATAHDLTTPLLGLKAFIGVEDEEARNLAERLMIIVRNIVDFLRLGGRRKAPECKAFDLAELTRNAYRLFAADYEDLSRPVIFDSSVERPTWVCADETLTLQILWNVFGNDLKYAAPYGNVRVSISPRPSVHGISVVFADDGQGMTPRQMKKAFNRYYRASTVLESGKGGFGIGLCTSREFARAMGGDLTVAANSPHGCIFTLTLPAVAFP